ncbi:DUF3885 domain-containing protein [Streptomyces sp. C10-9-1]|uniref:DUF3885 domain-containing protein n=1 Tax=Streptomyces sp. C10-9-1 TaxID=1859285 RepID=UPI003D711BDC
MNDDAPRPDPAHARLTRLWQAHRPAGPMLPWELNTVYGSRWVRFHSLPESKRHAEDEAECAVLLDRCNTVLQPTRLVPPFVTGR